MVGDAQMLLHTVVDTPYQGSVCEHLKTQASSTVTSKATDAAYGLQLVTEKHTHQTQNLA